MVSLTRKAAVIHAKLSPVSARFVTVEVVKSLLGLAAPEVAAINLAHKARYVAEEVAYKSLAKLLAGA